MSLIRLTLVSNKAEKPQDRKPLLLGASQIVSVEPERTGCKVTCTGGKTFNVYESADDVLDAAYDAPGAGGSAPRHRRGKMDAAQKALQESNPTDRPSDLTVDPHKAPAYGEPHPGAHAAEEYRKETGDPLANEPKELRREGAPVPGDPLPGHFGKPTESRESMDAMSEAASARQTGGEGDGPLGSAREGQEAAANTNFDVHPAEAHEGQTTQDEEDEEEDDKAKPAGRKPGRKPAAKKHK